jgi:hypothetical protein
MSEHEDIVPELRSEAANWSATCGGLFDRAADEIVRLRTLVHDLEAADRDHLSATNGMRTRLNDEIKHLRGQIEAARRAFHGTALMMRGVDSWPTHESIVGHVDAAALRELRIALGLSESSLALSSQQGNCK